MKQKPYRPEFCLVLLRAADVTERYSISLFLGVLISLPVVLSSHHLVYMLATLQRLSKDEDGRILDHQSPPMPVCKLHQLALIRDDNE